MNETPTLDLEAKVVPEANEASLEVTEGGVEGDQEIKIQVEAKIADLEQLDQFLTALEEAGLSPIKLLEAALQDPALTALKQALAEQMTPKQIQKVNQAIERVMQERTSFSKNQND